MHNFFEKNTFYGFKCPTLKKEMTNFFSFCGWIVLLEEVKPVIYFKEN